MHIILADSVAYWHIRLQTRISSWWSLLGLDPYTKGKLFKQDTVNYHLWSFDIWVRLSWWVKILSVLLKSYQQQQKNKYVFFEIWLLQSKVNKYVQARGIKNWFNYDKFLTALLSVSFKKNLSIIHFMLSPVSGDLLYSLYQKQGWSQTFLSKDFWRARTSQYRTYINPFFNLHETTSENLTNSRGFV